MHPVKQKPIREVTSRENSLIKTFRRALADGRTREGWLAVEGPHLVEEALEAAPRARIESVLIANDTLKNHERIIAKLDAATEVTRVPAPLFDHIAGTETPQGIAALVDIERTDLDGILSAPGALLLVACGIQDPGNLGSMLRSAHALGGTALVAMEGTVSPFNPKTMRASAGAIFHLPVIAMDDADILARAARAKGIRLIAAERSSSSPVREADLRGSVAIFIGREGSGLDPKVTREMDLLLSIPLRSSSDSLNAAVAAGIFLYEASRQRGIE